MDAEAEIMLRAQVARLEEENASLRSFTDRCLERLEANTESMRQLGESIKRMRDVVRELKAMDH